MPLSVHLHPTVSFKSRNEILANDTPSIFLVKLFFRIFFRIRSFFLNDLSQGDASILPGNPNIIASMFIPPSSFFPTRVTGPDFQPRRDPFMKRIIFLGLFLTVCLAPARQLDRLDERFDLAYQSWDAGDSGRALS